MHISGKGTIALLALALALPACVDDDDGGNSTPPQWIYQDAQKPHPIAVVFVHGLIGDTKGTWTNGGKSFFDYLHDSPGVGDQVDIYAFGFTSKMVGDGSLKIGEAAIKLNEMIKDAGIDRYDQIVFVAHSMGGLITLRELISRPEVRAKVPLVVFYATPQEGAQIAKIGQLLKDNKAVRQMLPSDSNDYLEQLQEDWVNVRNGPVHPRVICAYETKPLPVLGVIVPKTTATRFCDQNASAIEDSDHVTLVKPNGLDHPSVVVLRNALKDYAMPALSDASWEPQKIDTATQPWSYVIEDAGGPNPVHFKNRARIAMPLSVRSLDGGFVPIQDDKPPLVQPNGEGGVELVLFNPLKTEYPLEVRLGRAPPRTLIARITDMDRAIAQRNALRDTTTQHMNAWIETGDNKARLEALPTEQRNEKFLALATESIAQLHPEMPESARLVLAADTLNTLGLSGGAAHALSTVEARYPEVAKTAGVRRLAGIVSARTGNDAVLEHVDVPAIPADEALKPADFSTATDAQRHHLDVFADHLRTIPATHAEGAVLKGDVAMAAGHDEAAARAYTEAQHVEATPVVRHRMRSAAEVHR
ncbi:hypothetical protein LF41_1446 [Lysobacter dokdonensis DS-58]|uniref:GPI inositol-deacylase PGAP1-like alpha/beta domain-containing protein n=1 Tax=Lysobacter dokdonensis DS-58 TaxID=1300345 RepID=A0A0A2WHA8_9GAMM|nr:hypothetical protein [Lysobacter dokdonensis]KGQ18092.1 hypothetical protein LF41_1446 [Lysobacter dokdonensis DS-58]